MSAKWKMWAGLCSAVLLMLPACSGISGDDKPILCSSSKQGIPLCAPSGASPQVRAAINKGNEMFAVGRWEAAKQEYESAVAAQPDSAEAHYNLGLVHYRLGERDPMRDHFMQAANLAPGHKKIWDSPALRRYGDVPEKKSSSSSPSVGPSFGGGGRGGILGGGR